jgi:hypothetical protein
MGVFNVLCLAFAPSWWPSTYPFCRVFAKTKYFFLIYLFILVRVPELSKLGVGSTFGLVFFSWGLGWGKGLWGLKTIDPIQWHSWRYLRCFYSGIKSFHAMGLFDWPIIKKFWQVWRLPNTEIFTPNIQVSIFGHVYLGSKRMTMDKAYIGTKWGDIGNRLRILWEHIGNNKKVQHLVTLPPKKDKTGSIGCMLWFLIPHWLSRIYIISKSIHHLFCRRLNCRGINIGGQQRGGVIKERRVQIVEPSICLNMHLIRLPRLLALLITCKIIKCHVHICYYYAFVSNYSKKNKNYSTHGQ